MDNAQTSPKLTQLHLQNLYLNCPSHNLTKLNYAQEQKYYECTFMDVAGVLCKKGLSLNLWGFVYKMYIKNGLILANKDKQYKENGVY